MGAELLPCLRKETLVGFKINPELAVAENSIYEVLDIVLVLFKVVELKTLAVALHVIVDLDKALPVEFVAIVGVFPLVGQAEPPVNVFE